MGRRVMLIVGAAIVALAIGVGVAFAAASNARSSNTGGDTLAGPTWTLTRLEVDGKVGKPASARGAPTITFHSDGQFNGFSGCNTYGGKYALAGGRITLSDTAMTLMACVNPDLTTDSDAMSFEADYMLGLGRITECLVSGDTLTLRDSAGKVTMTFRRGA
jgi:heat shock protein HslJ